MNRSNFATACRPLLVAAVALALSAPMSHAHEGEDPDPHPAPKGMRVAIEAIPSKMGFNLHLTTRRFRFTPQHADGAHRNGKGHAHLWVDGVKVTRIYGPWHYLGGLAPGQHEVRVTLNGNDHGDYMIDDVVVSASVMVEVPAPTN